MKIKTVLRPDKQKDGSQSIRVRVTIGTKIKYFPVGFSCKPSEWDSVRGRCKPTRINYTKINAEIQRLEQSLEESYIETGTFMTGAIADFYYWFDLIISDREKLAKAGQHSAVDVKQLKWSRDTLKEFAPELQVKQVTFDFVNRYKSWLIELGYAHNTVSVGFLAKLRQVCKYLTANGTMAYHKNPFHHIEITTQESEARRLAFEQIQHFENFPLRTKRQKLARDMFCFSFYMGGIRFGDMCRLRHDMIKEGIIYYTINKSKRTGNKTNMDTPISSVAQRIINRNRTDSPYLFATKVDWKNEEHSINHENSRLDHALKLACRNAGLPKMSMHNARHSVADRAAEMGLDTKTLQGVYGHSQEVTTARYQRKFYKKKTHEAIRRMFGE